MRFNLLVLRVAQWITWNNTHSTLLWCKTGNEYQSHSVLPHTILAPEIPISHHSSQNQRTHFISPLRTRTLCAQTNLPSPHQLLPLSRFLWKPEFKVSPAFTTPNITQLWLTTALLLGLSLTCEQRSFKNNITQRFPHGFVLFAF